MPLALVGDQLVGHDQTHAGAGFAVEGQIEGDIVDDMADAAAGDHHHRCADHLCHAGVVQSQHRADAAVAGPLDDEEVATPVQFGNGVEDLCLEGGGRTHAVEQLPGGFRLQDHR